MAFMRDCDSCGRTYRAQRGTSKFCSDTCRKRGLRRGPQPESTIDPEGPSLLVESLTRELEAAGLLESRLGRQAIHLAEKITDRHETGSAIAAVSKELDRLVDKALASVGNVADPVDELRGRRDSKRREATG